jgi:hypothetical protein
MRNLIYRALLLVAGTFAGKATADTFVEGFDGGSNSGGWTYFAPDEVIESTGGNPGAHLHAWNMDTFAPQLRTAWGVPSVFNGDFRGRQVSSVGVDLFLYHVDFSAEDRPLSIILVHDNFTPTDFDDDYGAYFIGAEDIPLVGEGWKSFDFDIPTQANDLPEGWEFVQFGPNAPADPDWVDVVSHVSQLVYFYGDPTGFFIFQFWDVGADNLRITEGAATEAAILDFNVTFGTHLSGGVAELEQSDDTFVRARSRFGFTAAAPNLMEIRIDFETANLSAPTLDVEIESRLNQTGGTARIRLRDWIANSFVEIDQHPIGNVEMTRTVSDIDSGNLIRQTDGLIRLSVRHSTLTVFSAAGFTSFFDRTAALVNP